VEPSGPFGAKAVGEIPVDGVAPAVRNAVLDATGVALNALPLTPERVWSALRDRTPTRHPERVPIAGP
jgi:putative selenate reductase molybdopterin-binding subunit